MAFDTARGGSGRGGDLYLYIHSLGSDFGDASVLPRGVLSSSSCEALFVRIRAARGVDWHCSSCDEA